MTESEIPSSELRSHPADPTERAERITSRPPLAAVPPAPATGFALSEEMERIALVGRLLTSLDAYAAEATEDRVRASEDRVKAEIDRKQFRAWFTRANATQDAQLGLIRGDIQRINRRLEEGDALFRDHRAALLAKDNRISELVDCVSAMNLEVQSMRASAKATGSAGALAGLALLVLEDSDLMRRAIRRVCTDYGANVLEARTIAEAQAVVDSRAPLDVVTVDLRLENEDAMPFVRELKASCAVGVVIMTGHATEDQALEAEALGVPVLNKPFSIEALLRAVGAAVLE